MRQCTRTQTAFICVIIITSLLSIIYMNNFSKVEENLYFPKMNYNYTAPSHGCVLPNNDPYDPSLSNYINPHFNEFYRRKCASNLGVISSFENNTVTVKDPGFKCDARCFEGGELPGRMDNFTSIENSRFECEFVEVKCMKRHWLWSFFDKEYNMVHTQIIPKSTRSSWKPNQYNVFVFLLDSTSSASSKRNLQKSLHFMKHNMEAVTFPFINRVGVNSRPNAMALFYGKQILDIDRTVIGMTKEQADWSWDDSCARDLDKETSIFHEFKDKGFMTMFTDDWSPPLFSFPRCKGWTKPIIDHILGSECEKVWIAKRPYYNSNCVFLHNLVLNHTQMFIDVYKDRPMFVWDWMAAIVHDYDGGGQVIDQDLARFLSRNQDLMDNSFVIIMGDHGCRMCPMSKKTYLGGQVEVNNPFFTMSVPKELRTPGILGTLRENSGKLQTHYDTRATLLDILKYQPDAKFADRNPMKIPGEKGNSYLRRQEGERSCRTLPIPFPFCLCQYPMEEMDVNSPLVVAAGQAVIDAANERIRKAGLDKKCNLWLFDKVESVFGFSPVSKTGSMKIVVAPSWPYSEARMITFATRKHNGTFSINVIDRLDKYGNRNNCESGYLQPLCDCKNNNKK